MFLPERPAGQPAIPNSALALANAKALRPSDLANSGVRAIARTTIPFMSLSSSGRVTKRFLLIQALIVTGLVILVKLVLPYQSRGSAEQRAQTRERKIMGLFHDSVEDLPKREIDAPLNGEIVKRHPQKLRATMSPQDVEARLGAPDATSTDFKGGQHLIWLGAAHKLDASFNAGRLYALSLEDRTTRHGVTVYESMDLWHPY